MPLPPRLEQLRESAAPKLGKLRESAAGAVEMASGRLKEAKFKLMKTSESEAEIEEEEESQAPSQASSRMEEFTDAYCPKLTFQQVSYGKDATTGILFAPERLFRSYYSLLRFQNRG